MSTFDDPPREDTPTPTPSADRLREAARVLRERAEAAAEGPWQEIDDRWSEDPTFTVWGGPNLHDEITGEGLPFGDAIYIATMHPGVGLALADWLLWTSVLAENDGTLGSVTLDRALTLADLILGAES